MAEKYFYGQGRVLVSQYGENKYRWLGDVSALSIAMEIEKIEHKESFSGQKSLVRTLVTDRTATVNMTLHQLDADNLGLALYGTKSSIAAAGGDVTYPFPTVVAVGDEVVLPHTKLTDTPTVFTIKDSAGIPVTLTRNTHYTVDLDRGTVVILDIAAFTQPFVATYRNAAAQQVAMFKSAQPVLSMVYEGINLAEANAKVRVELYRVATDPLQELQLINNEQALNGLQIAAGLLIDSSKPASGDLGQFARIVEDAA